MATIDYCGNRAAIRTRKVLTRRKIPNKFQGRKKVVMNKTNKTPETMLDFFTGSGKINIDTDAVTPLLVKTIENLFAMGHRVEDLEDSCRITAAMMNEYYIPIPVSFSCDFLEKYVQTLRNRTVGKKKRYEIK